MTPPIRPPSAADGSLRAPCHKGSAVTGPRSGTLGESGERLSSVDLDLTKSLGKELRLPSPVEELLDDRLASKGVRVWLKRDDLIHPDVPGNKWRKLKYNLLAADRRRHRTLLTFGGAYSNHIRATAAAGQHCGFATIGVIRGEEHLPLNPSLAYAAERGMRLTYLDRTTYRRNGDPDLIAALRREFGPFYLLPEGGSNRRAVIGCAEAVAEIRPGFDVLCCPCGTGGTLAGLAAGLGPRQRALGFSALKGARFLDGDVRRLQEQAFGGRRGDWRIHHDHHFGGYAKKPPELTAFIANFADRHRITLEWVYVAKMMYGLHALVDGGAFEPGTRIVAVVTGPPGIE
jgi:1-aminocyclopropane-1-carboxylate deaminase